METPKQFRRVCFTLTSESLIKLTTFAINNALTDSKALDTILLSTSTEKQTNEKISKIPKSKKRQVSNS